MRKTLVAVAAVTALFFAGHVAVTQEARTLAVEISFKATAPNLPPHEGIDMAPAGKVYDVTWYITLMEYPEYDWYSGDFVIDPDGTVRAANGATWGDAEAGFSALVLRRSGTSALWVIFNYSHRHKVVRERNAVETFGDFLLYRGAPPADGTVWTLDTSRPTIDGNTPGSTFSGHPRTVTVVMPSAKALDEGFTLNPAKEE